ncbi:hypothetical protein [Kribbella sp. NPDC004875]|uniref:hypothetical protein n=1 Tax=Kribbella sp. NPDC004875 TaxID=3364107 RepID=UPI0036A812F1
MTAIIGNVISCSLAAFAFARLNFFGRRIAYVTMLVTLMLPTHVTLVPQYILFNKLGWVNTFYPRGHRRVPPGGRRHARRAAALGLICGLITHTRTARFSWDLRDRTS